MAFPPEFSNTETYANRYDLDKINVFYFLFAFFHYKCSKIRYIPYVYRDNHCANYDFFLKNEFLGKNSGGEDKNNQKKDLRH